MYVTRSRPLVRLIVSHDDLEPAQEYRDRGVSPDQEYARRSSTQAKMLGELGWKGRRVFRDDNSIDSLSPDQYVRIGGAEREVTGSPTLIASIGGPPPELC